MIGLTEILIVVVIILLFTGPSKLPNLAKSLGEGYRNFKKAKAGKSDIDITDSVKRLDDQDRS